MQVVGGKPGWQPVALTVEIFSFPEAILVGFMLHYDSCRYTQPGLCLSELSGCVKYCGAGLYTVHPRKYAHVCELHSV